jgi:serine/threonine-protein kinase
MGNVYLAEDQRLSRQVAVKTIRPELSGNAEVRARIARECRLHAAIGVHPHIVTLHDTVEENGHLYLVMEYFAGKTLAEQLAASGGSRGLPFHLALDIIGQVLRALACIHGHDMVHRVIKTSNILLQPGPDGRHLVKLTDFGIALIETESAAMDRLTSLGTQGPGTPVYMAPERIDPQTFGAICPATDLYAVGIILYELLTGAPPFKGSMTEVFTGHLMQDPRLEDLPPALPAAIRAVLHKALAKKPEDRYQAALSFLDGLEHLEATPGCRPDSAPDATLLATANSSTAANPRATDTVLNPAVGRPRTFPTSTPKWLYLAAALVIALAAYVLRAHWFRAPAAQPEISIESAPTAAAPTKQAAKSDQSPVDRETDQKPSALQTVEAVRQDPHGESKTIDPPKGAGTLEPKEWQVIETHSRKIR